MKAKLVKTSKVANYIHVFLDEKKVFTLKGVNAGSSYCSYEEMQ